MKVFGREPTLILQVISAVLGLLVTFQLPNLSAEQAGAIVAVLAAAISVVNALLVRPVAPAAFTGFVAATVALVSAYGFNVSQETVGGLNAVVVTVLALIFRAQVTPVAHPGVGPVD